MKRARPLSNSQNYDNNLNKSNSEKFEPATKKRKVDSTLVESRIYGETHCANIKGEARFHSWCQSILNRTLTTEEISQNFQDNFFFATLETNDLEAKENDIPDTDSQTFPLNRFSSEEMQMHPELYQNVLKKVHYHIDDQAISAQNKFYLQILLAKLSYRFGKIGASITHYTHAKTILFHASYAAENEWLIDDSTDQLEKVINEKLIKYNLKIAKSIPIENNQKMNIESPENILASKTYVQENIKFKNGLDLVDFLGLLNSPQAPQFSKSILLLNALDSLIHYKFAIYIFIRNINDRVNGFYNQKNKVAVYSKAKLIDKKIFDTKQVSENTLLHELMHKALDRVFDNETRPYFKDNLKAQMTYQQCMREVLINCIEAVIPFKKLALFPSNKSCNISCKNKKSYPSIKFPHSWDRNMSFDHLIENCFGDNQLPKLAHILSDSGQLKISPYLKTLLNKLQRLFGKNGYDRSVLDAEFITNMSCRILIPEAQSSKLIQPLKDFIEEFVLPQMELYIANHPCRHQIETGD